MKNVLVVSVDSDIGSAIVDAHRARGNTVIGSSRTRGKSDYLVELAHPGQWTVPDRKFDAVYFTLAVANDKMSRAEVMYVNTFATLDYLKFIAPHVADGGQIVVLTTTNSSLRHVAKEASPVYSMSKAALNLGVKIYALNGTRLRWTLICPGRVRTKMNRYQGREDVYTPKQAGELLVTAADSVQSQFCFINQLGEVIA